MGCFSGAACVRLPLDLVDVVKDAEDHDASGQRYAERRRQGRAELVESWVRSCPEEGEQNVRELSEAGRDEQRDDGEGCPENGRPFGLLIHSRFIFLVEVTGANECGYDADTTGSVRQLYHEQNYMTTLYGYDEPTLLANSFLSIA